MLNELPAEPLKPQYEKLRQSLTHGEIRSNVVASQSELHARFGGAVPEIASRRHSNWSPGGARGARRGRDEAGGDRPRRGHARAGADRRPPRRSRRRQGHRLGPWPATRAGRPPARARRVAVPATDRPRATVPLPARERRPHAARRAGSCRVPVVGTTVDDAPGRRSTRERLLGLGYPGGAAIDRLARRAILPPTTSRSPVFRGSISRSPVPRRRSPASAISRRRSGAAPRRPGGVVPARDRPRARRADRAGRRGARRRQGGDRRRRRSQLRAAFGAPGSDRSAARACTDNAAMIASAARYAEPAGDPLRLDAYAVA